MLAPSLSRMTSPFGTLGLCFCCVTVGLVEVPVVFWAFAATVLSGDGMLVAGGVEGEKATSSEDFKNCKNTKAVINVIIKINSRIACFFLSMSVKVLLHC